MKFGNRTATPASVGTGGACEEGWGPGACPCCHLVRWFSVKPNESTLTRTGTRPPHPPHPSPCPYRWDASALLYGQFIKTPECFAPPYRINIHYERNFFIRSFTCANNSSLSQKAKRA